MKTVILRTGTANIASVCAGLLREGIEAEISVEPDKVRSADAVVVPGVGAFAASMGPLREQGLEQTVRERVEREAPTLAVCVGMQLFADKSEESPGTAGLGIWPLEVTRFGPAAPRVPQLGWNHVEVDPRCRFLESGFVYFANSFKLPAAPPGWVCARANHGETFVAGAERGAVLACQFHPELSGAVGRRVLGRWIQRARELRA